MSGIEGTFRITCQNVMRVLRDNHDSVMSMLEAFVHDPLIGWKILHGADDDDLESKGNVAHDSDDDDDDDDDEDGDGASGEVKAELGGAEAVAANAPRRLG